MRIFRTRIIFKTDKEELVRMSFEEDPSPDLEDIATQVLTDTVGPERLGRLWGKIEMQIERL